MESFNGRGENKDFVGFHTTIGQEFIDSIYNGFLNISPIISYIYHRFSITTCGHELMTEHNIIHKSGHLVSNPIGHDKRTINKFFTRKKLKIGPNNIGHGKKSGIGAFEFI
jgi:hypothetical protein